MRWPFGPPHLTLKPSKKQENKKNKKKRSKKKKQAKIPKNSFSVISQNFPFFLLAFQNLPFLTPWPKKRAPKKHYKNRGFRHFFLKSRCASRNGHFWNKKPKFINSSYHLFLPIFFSFNNKKPQNCWNPYFYSVLANLKKENFQNLNLKHWKLKNPIFAPFFWKRLFLENWQITGNKKTQTDNWEPKITWNPRFL